MIRMISDSPRKNGERVIEFAYDPNNSNDKTLLQEFMKVLKEQPRCENCQEFYYQGCIGGYMACACKIHGILESYSHPHFDMDGSKCEDYRRQHEK